MTKVEWNKVTSLSKLIALIVFIAMPIAGFCLGKWYQKQITFNVVPAQEKSDIVAGSGQKKTTVASETLPPTLPEPPTGAPGELAGILDASSQQASVPPPPAPVPGKSPTVPVTTGGQSGF